MVRFSRIVDIFDYYDILLQLKKGKKENKVILNKRVLCGVCLAVASSVANSAIIGFDFTGRLVVADGGGNIISNNGSTYTPISASLTYDTVSGFGNSGLSITMDADGFLGFPPTFHDITLDRIEGTNLIDGNILVDWNGNTDMSLHIEWDATGLFNAIDFGLQVGDTISGSTLIKGLTVVPILEGDGLIALAPEGIDVGSATPYSDSLQSNPADTQGPAPLAATSNSLGLGVDSPLPGIVGYFDIGSGNSLHVTSVSAVPVPAAVWLFGSGLLALVGFAKRKV